MPVFQTPQGVNFHLADDMLGPALSEALCSVVSFLCGLELPNVKLYQYDDWWQHDGLHFYRREVSPSELVSTVASASSPITSMPGDFSVSVGVAPADNDWYLRFYLEPDAGNEPPDGRFDLTLPSEVAERFRREVIQPLQLNVCEQDASTYYQSIGTGPPAV